MSEFADLSALLQSESNQLDILQTLFNFFVCIVMAFILRKFYINRSYSLSGKLHIGSVLPILSAVVFLVIVVVKSSLALSLGLVGALSIVRFRTPIKEPEELVYLFLAIAIGLGYGAGHTLLTTLLVSIILAIIYFWLSNRQTRNNIEYNLILSWEDSSIPFQQLAKKIENSLESMSLVRLECNSERNTAVLLAAPKETIEFDRLYEELHKDDKTLSITFFEAKNNW